MILTQVFGLKMFQLIFNKQNKFKQFNKTIILSKTVIFLLKQNLMFEFNTKILNK